MKTMIAIPCMDMVPVSFVHSLLYLDKSEGDVSVVFESGSLIYDSRNRLLQRAIENNFDRILWLDSDMEFKADVMKRLSADLDEGYDFVTGLYTKRRPPFSPVIFKECAIHQLQDGSLWPAAVCYEDYPKDEIFEIEGCGFGCVMMTIDSAKKLINKLGRMPFMPVAGFGEDISFCMRMKEAGIKMMCDSRIVFGHIGFKAFYGVENG